MRQCLVCPVLSFSRSFLLSGTMVWLFEQEHATFQIVESPKHSLQIKVQFYDAIFSEISSCVFEGRCEHASLPILILMEWRATWQLHSCGGKAVGSQPCSKKILKGMLPSALMRMATIYISVHYYVCMCHVLVSMPQCLFMLHEKS